MPKEKNGRYVLDGYEFVSGQDYEQAKKEAESIAYVRSGLDIKNEEALFQTYQDLTKNAQYRTPIGLGFLRELQRHLARKEEIRRKMSMIPVPAGSSGAGEVSNIKDSEKQTLGERKKEISREMEDAYRGRIRNMRVVIGILVALVLLLFIVTWTDRTVDVQAERDKILDEYAGWKEELKQWEEELEEREAALENPGQNTK